MRSKTKATYARLLAAGVVAAAAMAAGPSVTGKQPGSQIWNPVKQKMLAGQDVVAKERVFIPLTPDVVKEELKKLD